MSTFNDVHLDQLAAYTTYVPGQQYYNTVVSSMLSDGTLLPEQDAPSSIRIDTVTSTIICDYSSEAPQNVLDSQGLVPPVFGAWPETAEYTSTVATPLRDLDGYELAYNDPYPTGLVLTVLLECDDGVFTLSDGTATTTVTGNSTDAAQMSGAYGEVLAVLAGDTGTMSHTVTGVDDVTLTVTFTFSNATNPDYPIDPAEHVFTTVLSPAA